jgi:energy-coupling factor transporter ATP-binding protein EcfA2
MKIIALKGKNGSGKSTVAAMLAKKLDEKGVSNKVLSFAEPLKTFMDLTTKAKREFWEIRKFKEDNRKVIEDFASAIKESFSFNPFSYQVCIDLDSCYAKEIQVVIISDLRFQSEYDGLYNWLETEDLTVIEITNPLTQNNPPEYDELLIKANKTLIFGKDIEIQLDSLIKEIL